MLLSMQLEVLGGVVNSLNGFQEVDVILQVSNTKQSIT